MEGRTVCVSEYARVRVCMYVCMYVCMAECFRVAIHTCIPYTCIHTYIHTYIHTGEHDVMKGEDSSSHSGGWMFACGTGMKFHEGKISTYTTKTATHGDKV